VRGGDYRSPIEGPSRSHRRSRVPGSHGKGRGTGLSAKVPPRLTLITEYHQREDRGRKRDFYDSRSRSVDLSNVGQPREPIITWANQPRPGLTTCLPGQPLRLSFSLTPSPLPQLAPPSSSRSPSSRTSQRSIAILHFLPEFTFLRVSPYRVHLMNRSARVDPSL